MEYELLEEGDLVWRGPIETQTKRSMQLKCSTVQEGCLTTSQEWMASYKAQLESGDTSPLP